MDNKFCDHLYSAHTVHDKCVFWRVTQRVDTMSVL